MRDRLAEPLAGFLLERTAMARFSGVLLDLGGVVFVGDKALPGAIDAVDKLRRAGLRVRFLTNTTRQPVRTLVAKLSGLGLHVDPDEVLTPARAARTLLAGKVPHLLVHPDLLEDFDSCPAGKADVVIIGDASDGFSYASLNAAFRALEGGAQLVALAGNRSFKDSDGQLSLDAGPFVAALEYASGRHATIIGKPARPFFEAALSSLGVEAGAAVMVGDDVEADVAGALYAGLAGVLVRTGKYKPDDERRIDPPPTAVCDHLPDVVDWILDG
jgi:HAD superfamily hydrolase (TIGR01458 family)